MSDTSDTNMVLYPIYTPIYDHGRVDHYVRVYVYDDGKWLILLDVNVVGTIGIHLHVMRPYVSLTRC
jgi:hypothetical protein